MEQDDSQWLLDWLLIAGVFALGVLAILIGLFLFITFAYAGDLPNSTLTPGAAGPLTASQLCAPTFRTSSVRKVSAKEKAQVYREYGLAPRAAPCPCEVDHLISLEIGGSNALANLWPQSYSGQWNAHVKDRLENRLHRLVCSGQLTLGLAQRAIAGNWITAYKEWMK